MKVGYCTNVHAGTSLDQVIGNLRTFARPVKSRYSTDQPMSISLWFSDRAVSETLQHGGLARLQEVLSELELVPNTFNAFPCDDFHEAVVKYRVYLPDWSDPRRLQYTLRVATLQAALLPPGSGGSISTLPIGWPYPGGPARRLELAAGQLRECAMELERIHGETGVSLRLAIEPEPGCILDSADDLVQFMNEYVIDAKHEGLVRRRIGVCHDVCHSAVMFEDQSEALDLFARSGISVAKVQISSAIAANIKKNADKEPILRQIAAFEEARYLHQTMFRFPGRVPVFVTDLDLAVQFARTASPPFQLRSHFHVPIHLREIGLLRTTQDQILECLAWFGAHREAMAGADFEVETYAWHVAPESARGHSLVDSLVSELTWLESKME
jgi:hypothetical protein